LCDWSSDVCSSDLKTGNSEMTWTPQLLVYADLVSFNEQTSTVINMQPLLTLVRKLGISKHGEHILQCNSNCTS
jgi:hypothetical protein